MIDASVLRLKDSFVIYFSTSNKTYRYVSGEEKLYEVDKPQMGLLQEYSDGILRLENGKIGYIIRAYE